MFRERLLILWLLVKQNWLVAILGGVGLALILTGLVSTLVSSSQPKDIIFDKITDATASARIFIDVQGAVVSPGVYELKQDSRVQDVLILAGGLSSLADRDWVSKNLNLARKVADGTKIYVPRAGESVSQNISGSENQIIGVSEGLVNINTASLGELDKLPGIGPVTGQKIIDNRPYSETGELLTKKAVGKKVFEQIKEKITVY